MITTVIKLLAEHYEASLRDGQYPMSFYKHNKQHSRCKQTQSIAIILSKIGMTSEDRHHIMTTLFGREITSTYELSVGEANAMLKVLSAPVTLAQFRAYAETARCA